MVHGADGSQWQPTLDLCNVSAFSELFWVAQGARSASSAAGASAAGSSSNGGAGRASNADGKKLPKWMKMGGK